MRVVQQVNMLPFRLGLVCFRQRSRQSQAPEGCIRIKIGVDDATALPSATAAGHLIGALVGLATGDCGLSSRRDPTAGRGSVSSFNKARWVDAPIHGPLRQSPQSPSPSGLFHVGSPSPRLCYSGHLAACPRCKRLVSGARGLCRLVALAAVRLGGPPQVSEESEDPNPAFCLQRWIVQEGAGPPGSILDELDASARLPGACLRASKCVRTAPEPSNPLMTDHICRPGQTLTLRIPTINILCIIDWLGTHAGR